MQITKFTLPGILTVMLFVVTSCSKDSDIPEFASAGCEEGQTGNITLDLAARHHNKIIPSQPNYPDTAFIKFNTSEFPGDDPALYDLVLTGESPDTLITVNYLSCGNYYFFMTGFDAAIAQRVKGGIPVTLNNEDLHRIINVPVTED